ncbi:MAG: phosphoadenosine phosphosulfate reductase family protein [Planctomycetota bacterium]
MLQDKIKKSIMRLKEFEPADGYYLAFSGGKDSVVLKALAVMAGVKFDAHYNVTTIDPPELVQFIRQSHPDVIFDRPKRPLLVELVKRGFPTRLSRWCCAEYKEKGGSGRFVLLGVRSAESHKRSKRKMVETCYKDNTKRILNPIIDWTDSEIWDFIRQYKIPYCKLYDEGFKRIGCVFCPNAYYKRRLNEARRYPGFARAFIKYFNKLYENRKANGSHSVDRWKNGEDMFWWWLGEPPKKKLKPQITQITPRNNRDYAATSQIKE